MNLYFLDAKIKKAAFASFGTPSLISRTMSIVKCVGVNGSFSFIESGVVRVYK